jgi:hypothetical protein
LIALCKQLATHANRVAMQILQTNINIDEGAIHGSFAEPLKRKEQRLDWLYFPYLTMDKSLRMEETK